jgi:hypothetical protein
MGRYKEAGDHYQKAWKLKKKKLENIYRAAECYFLVKDFNKASKCYAYLENNFKEFPKSRFKYSLSLKQNANYSEAIDQFKMVMAENSSNSSLLLDAEREIKGCEMALAVAGDNTDWVEITHPGKNINSTRMEFGPIPINENLLYFSSTRREDKAKIYYSQREDGVWSRAKLPDRLPDMKSDHYGNGSFTPDLKRFYFTQCESFNEPGVLKGRCSIYMILKRGEEWSEPIMLPDYINMKKTNTTHPSVVHSDGQEILYFSSDRSGGYGGNDIWFATRGLTSDGMDFEFPKNAGSRINTSGDEVTPFYSKDESALYFGSDGHIGFGGKDILVAKGKQDYWQKAENLGLPFNTEKDDYYYTQVPNTNGQSGFFVSSRSFGELKKRSTHDDIFSYNHVDQQDIMILAQGVIKDENTLYNLTNSELVLYEILGNSELRVLQALTSEEGNYEFRLLPNKEYKIEMQKEGYETAFSNINTIGITENRIIETPIFSMITEEPVQVSTDPDQVMDPAAPIRDEKMIPVETEVEIPSDIQKTKSKFEEKSEEEDQAFKPEDIYEETEEDVDKVIEEEYRLAIQEAAREEELEKQKNDEEEPVKTEGAVTASIEEDVETPQEIEKTLDENNMVDIPMTKEEAKEEPEVDDPSMESPPVISMDTPVSNPELEEAEIPEEDEEALFITYKTDYYPYYTLTARRERLITTHYKVQFFASKDDNRQFDEVTNVGELSKENINERNLTRYLVGTYKSSRKAYKALKKVKEKGFSDAFLVRYDNGLRVFDIFK